MGLWRSQLEVGAVASTDKTPPVGDEREGLLTLIRKGCHPNVQIELERRVEQLTQELVVANRKYEMQTQARVDERVAARAEVGKLREALEELEPLQQKALAYIGANGFVFDDIGNEPGNWKHLAFSLYTDLCQVDSVARAALAEKEQG
jgi:hypothetical protein